MGVPDLGLLCMYYYSDHVQYRQNYSHDRAPGTWPSLGLVQISRCIGIARPFLSVTLGRSAQLLIAKWAISVGNVIRPQRELGANGEWKSGSLETQPQVVENLNKSL